MLWPFYLALIPFTIACDAEKHKKTAKAVYKAALGAFGKLVADLLPKEMPILV
jgi:hypothetical protein